MRHTHEVHQGLGVLVLGWAGLDVYTKKGDDHHVVAERS